MKVGGETMSSTLRFSRGFLAAIITLCVFFTCLPFSRTVRADGEPTVYYAYEPRFAPRWILLCCCLC